MIRIAVPGFGFLIGLTLWVYAVLDVIQTDESLTRNLPKQLWVFLVLLFPPIGPIAWLIAGRPLYAGWAPGGTQYRPPTRSTAIEDQPGFGGKPVAGGPSAEQLQRWEDDLARREREINGGDDEAPPG